MRHLIGVIYFLCATAMVLLLASNTGCAPSLSAQSPAPPGRSARLDEVKGFWGVKSYRLELSTGVALAVTCYSGGPCEKLIVTSDDPKVAEVRPASLGTLEKSGFAGNQQSAAGVVVVGKTAGTTKLHVKSKAGSREIAVTIVPAPPPTVQATLAK
ncbi:MAG: hypothetical protein ABI867_19840 [Kofleriaceae bacterium]